MQFRAFVGTSVLCDFAGALLIDIPRSRSRRYVLTAWINPPAANDVAFIYDEGPLAGNADDSWQPYSLRLSPRL